MKHSLFLNNNLKLVSETSKQSVLEEVLDDNSVITDKDEEGWMNIQYLAEKIAPLYTNNKIYVEQAHQIIVDFYQYFAQPTEIYDSACLSKVKRTFWQKVLDINVPKQELKEPKYVYTGFHLAKVLINGEYLPIKLIPQFNIVVRNCRDVSESYQNTLLDSMKSYTVWEDLFEKLEKK